MRLKPFDHVVAILIVLCMLALAVLAGLLCWMMPIEEFVVALLHSSFTGPLYIRIIITVVALILAFLCLRVLFVRKRRIGRDAPAPAAQGIMLRSGEHGTSFITISAIDAMVKKFIRTNSKVRDCKVAITPIDNQQNLNLDLSVVLMPDVVVPDACTELQDSLVAHIQAMTGILVKEVKVAVEDSTEPVAPKSRSVK